MERARVSTARVQRSTTSFATHLMKISPMNSDSESLAPGENQGELYVSVSARCCSAMTLREILWWHSLALGNPDEGSRPDHGGERKTR